MSQSPRYYERFSQMPFEEDMTHEFKGHRNFCMEEIPHWALTRDDRGRPSRKPISRNLCGFLNTGQGGTVYCGVVDNGTVHGMTLSQFQKDHIAGSVQDLLSRFTPPVPAHRYKVGFVPVLGSGVSEQKRKEMLAYKTRETVDPEERKRMHVFRGAEYCWCDQDTIARYKNGTLITEYVVEVTIHPWDADIRQNSGGLGSIHNLHPIHADDKGDIYFRRQASLCKYTMQEIAKMTFYEAEKRREKIIAKLQMEIAMLKSAKKGGGLDNDERNNNSNTTSTTTTTTTNPTPSNLHHTLLGQDRDSNESPKKPGGLVVSSLPNAKHLSSLNSLSSVQVQESTPSHRKSVSSLLYL